METICNIILISALYLFLNTSIFLEYVLKRFNNAIETNNTITNRGEIIKYIIFIIGYIFILAIT